jgi:pimeloyl-ACP methyl ester carboxylesterase
MWVRRYGSGNRVAFCLHGWSGDHSTFEPLVRFAPEGVQIVSGDLPGYGRSPCPREWRLNAVAEEIEQALAEAKASELTLVGNCLGALVGMAAALARPSLVHRLVLIDTFADWPWYFKVFTNPRWGRYAYATAFANPVGRWVTNQALASKRTPESDFTSGFAARIEYLDILQEIASARQFESLHVPVDVIYGEGSFRAIHESARVWKAIWPQTRIWKLPGAGHLVLKEATAAVSEIIFGGGACPAESARTSSSVLA